MATHDYIISNASGAAVRADLNNALAAIVTNNSSATEPTTTYAYQWWADTGSSPAVMKLRNAANSAWITLFQLDGEWTVVPFENGTAAAPSIYFKDSGTDTGIYSPGTDQVAITTGGTGRLFVDSSGRVGLGTSTFRSQYGVTPKLQIEGTDSTGSLSAIRNSNDGGGAYILLGKSRGAALTSSTIVQSGDVLGAVYFQGADGTDIETPAAGIEAVVDGTPGSNDMPGRLVFSTTADGSATPTERMRIDSSGRVGIGTTAAARRLHIAVAGSDPQLRLQDTSASESIWSAIEFIGDSSRQAFIGKAGSTDLLITNDNASGALRFSTNATEQMRINSSGVVLIGKTVDDSSIAGAVIRSTGIVGAIASADRPFFVNRLSNDGSLVEFLQDTIVEGTISVSGTTVSYNGAHLSRWSQLPGGAERTEILRGTVLSNTDEMCEWDDQDNEQLNRMKVSDIEGDPNVSGVFQAWDDDDDTYTDDFYCAMTGDFIIRIAEGVTVQRGDLLMSAGDGTAKPQDDDIIRNKTVAKVTSTHVACTYDDGSYCVPCVLMAC